MKVFVAGASGALGTHLVPKLVAKGHEVVGMTRTPSKQEGLRALGARPVVADALDPEAVAKVVGEAEPEVIVHQLTALSGSIKMRDMRHPERFGEATNRLRTEATDHLLAAGRAVGARRFIAQSYTAHRFARTGGAVLTEDDALDPDFPGWAPVVEALLHLEQAVTSIEWGEGLALRYGGFYGPDTGISSDPEAMMTASIRKRQLPVVGNGGTVWSWIHIDDAATATANAVEHGPSGIYNITDDEPAPMREVLPVLASALGAKPPRHIPRWLMRLVGGKGPTLMMTESRGSSNAKAKRELGLQLHYPSWRQGFAEGLG